MRFNGLDVLESLTDLISGSPWTYAYLVLVAALDAVFPLVPSETSVIAAGVLAASGDLNVGLVLVTAASGAIIGDNVSYVVGRTAGEPVANRFFRGKRRRLLDRAERMIEERGGYLIVIARFIPGGRTATTFSAGLLGMRWRRFLAFDVAAGSIWSVYATMIGFFGGKAFEDEPLKGIIVALVIAFAIAGGVELYRWQRKRSRAASEPAVDDGLDRG